MVWQSMRSMCLRSLRETDTICMTRKGTDIEPIAQEERDIIITIMEIWYVLAE